MSGLRDPRWLAAEVDPDASLRLFCFAHAGAGASAYRAWVAPLARAGVAVCPIQLPGRETRFGEPAHARLEPLLDALVPQLEPFLDRPFALFGHSMGALVAFGLARALRAAGGPLPVHLGVSGRIAPQLRDRRRRLHDLPDHELLAELRALGGIPAAALELGELLALTLPVLRADLALNESYRHVDGERLPLPITAFGGDADPKVDAEELRAWEHQTSARFRMRLLPGGHFFVNASLALLLPELLADLAVAA
jgi:medium-chain acyl-[acyl-carrier-protein] hydrolase